jgi:putative ABC transport system permease protein
VLIGLGMVYTIPWLSEWFTGSPIPAVVHWESILWALEVSIVVGVLFGLYPSQRAALLDPIEALRHE